MKNIKSFSGFLNELKKSTWDSAISKSNKKGYTDLSNRFKEHSDKYGDSLFIEVIDNDGVIKEVDINNLSFRPSNILYLDGKEVKITNKKDAINFIKIKGYSIDPKNIIHGYKPFVKNMGSHSEFSESKSDFISWLENKYPYGLENISKIKNFKVMYTKLTSLEGIERFKSLERLNCSYNNLIDLKGIENLTSLNRLECYDNNLIDLKGIENLTNLTHLNCFNNNLTSIEGIENLINLEFLQLGKNSISSLKGIENLTNLKILDISFNKNLTNIREIEKLKKLNHFISLNNNFSSSENEWIINYCKTNNIKIDISNSNSNSNQATAKFKRDPVELIRTHLM